MTLSPSVWGLGVVAGFALACSSTPEDNPLGGAGVGGNGSGGGSGTSSGAGGGSAAQGGTGGTGGAGGTGGTGGSAATSGSAGTKSTGGAGGAGGAGGTSGKSGASGKGGASGSATTGGAGGSSGKAGGAGMSGTSGTTASGDGPTIGGCAVFPPDDAWNQDISGEAVDATWTTRLQNMVGDVNLHPDYGVYGSSLYGIPIGVVPENQPLVPITWDYYPDESDPGPYPLPGPNEALIEGGDAMNCDGDCHFLVVQQGSCQLYEGYACHYEGGWHCGNGAHWDLTKNSYGQRPKGWTSADAAGLAITPGIVRYAEVRAGEVTHAIRFTTSCTRNNFVAPATHQAVPGDCDPNDPNSPPMGLRIRLKADFDISDLPQSAQVVLNGMKRYGMILADNGSDFYFQGEANAGWSDDDDISPLKTVPASAFEVVAVPPLEE